MCICTVYCGTGEVAVLNRTKLLQRRGFTREQPYVICSVAVDLLISNLVDVPKYVVSALSPEGVFNGH
jgi:formamidase